MAAVIQPATGAAENPTDQGAVAKTKPVTATSTATLDTLAASVSYTSSAPKSTPATNDPLTTPNILDSQTTTVILDNKLKDYCTVLIKEYNKNFPCNSAVCLFPLMTENQAKNAYELHFEDCSPDNKTSVQDWFEHQKK